VIRVNPHGDITVLADSYDGRRLNSPNDLVYRSDGTLYFTDPPFGAGLSGGAGAAVQRASFRVAPTAA
jgi:sugar lactone lactonase YvrE